jgi:hypothetical protein
MAAVPSGARIARACALVEGDVAVLQPAAKLAIVRAGVGTRHARVGGLIAGFVASTEHSVIAVASAAYAAACRAGVLHGAELAVVAAGAVVVAPVTGRLGWIAVH